MSLLYLSCSSVLSAVLQIQIHLEWAEIIRTQDLTECTKILLMFIIKKQKPTALKTLNVILHDVLFFFFV